ncbi:MAG TPA: phosphatase PAP2 family protein [Xanthobacteraceae bacterium]|nr:phosphatase PAP2 family protein [Xanthobacteraceae bacterium]
MGCDHLKRWAIAFVAMVVAVVISYQLVDRDVASYAAAHFQKKPWFDALTQISDWLARLAVIVFAVSAGYALTGRALPRPLAVGLVASASLAVASAIKDQLKFAFGRTWPETFSNNNPSFIHNHVYGFTPFHGGQAYAAFPSGHTTAVCAVMAVLWVCYPKLRPVYTLLVAAVVIGLIGADYHFVSDIIAGAFTGSLSGWVAVQLCRLGPARHCRPDGAQRNPGAAETGF